MAEENPRPLDVPLGMKPYFLALFVHGPNWTLPEGAEAKELLAAHLSFNRRMIEQKKFALAGPVFASDRVVGVAVISAPNLDEARAVAGQDPEVVAGRLSAEVYPAMLPSLDGVTVAF